MRVTLNCLCSLGCEISINSSCVLQNVCNLSWKERQEGKDLGESGCGAERGFNSRQVFLLGLSLRARTQITLQINLKYHEFSEIEIRVPFLALGAIFWCVVAYSPQHICFLYCELFCIFFFMQCYFAVGF